MNNNHSNYNNYNNHNKRQVRISSKTTGEARMSEPMPVQSARLQDVYEEVRALTTTNSPPDAASAFVEEPIALAGTTELLPTTSQVGVALSATAALAREALIGASHNLNNSVNRENSPAKHEITTDVKGATNSKVKGEIETLEQFIAYAFSRKGRSIKLTPKVQRVIAQSPALDEIAMNKLLALAAADAVLAVPRQLLLVAREMEGVPRLRAAINDFVLTLMQGHLVFAEADLQAVLRNLPEAPPAEVALKRVASYVPQSNEGKDDHKPSDMQAFRLNAINLMATWLAINQGFRLEDLAKLLFQSVWEPAARELVDDNARLRALTEIEQSGGVGLACEKFRQNAIEANATRDQAYRDAAILRETVTDLRARLEPAEIARDALTVELQDLKEISAKEMADVYRQHEIERTHFRHDHEQLRGRLVRRLSDSIEMLEVGLSALRNKTPRTEVMAERAEHVIDALRAEEKNLKEE